MSSLNEEVKQVWNEIAEWWDEATGEGNDFHKLLIEPVTDRLLDLKPGEKVLDIACGNGKHSRKLAQKGAQVVAFDFSEKVIEIAKMRTKDEEIEYRLIDATDREQLMSLGQGEYDAAVCTMAMQDMYTIEPLLDSLNKLLKPRGRFVFSVSHPCFNSSSGTTMVAKMEQKDGEVVIVHAVKISDYLSPSVAREHGILGQPIPTFNFHRPLNVVLNVCFKAGFVVDGLEEPAYPEDAEEAKHPFQWRNYRAKVPPAIVVRCHLSI